ncbi:hypothetical protein [Acinetobacter sp.]|uniref:hypothetical protein n=1 Tax=Acinetobacter sp. TaxID=472 RepID=UPI00388FD5DC
MRIRLAKLYKWLIIIVLITSGIVVDYRNNGLWSIYGMSVLVVGCAIRDMQGHPCLFI